jgi:hypothetical protein
MAWVKSQSIGEAVGVLRALGHKGDEACGLLMTVLQDWVRWWRNRAAESMLVASARWELPAPKAGPEHIVDLPYLDLLALLL